LKIISINTDFWYQANIFNYYNFTNPDNSGTLRFLISELEASEAANQRVWIIGHVPSGYGTGNPLPNPTALFYSIIARFSPATIAGVFFGHTHEDQEMIYYDFAASSRKNGSTLRNTTDINLNSPLMMGYIGPSITPLTNYNAGWQLYHVDAETFEVVNVQTFFANISNSAKFDPEPEWELEYDTREVYDPQGHWPEDAPLNATFWHSVTEGMLRNVSLAGVYTKLQTKSSAVGTVCDNQECAQSTVCSMRSGSYGLATAC